MKFALAIILTLFVLGCNALPAKTKRGIDSDCFGPCVRMYQPVCGTDGITYGNQCELSNAKRCVYRNIRLGHIGACTESSDTSACPQVCAYMYNPVCGTDGETYSNACNLLVNRCRTKDPSLVVAKTEACQHSTGKRAASEGRDCGDSFCFRIYAPVCGSDGRVYGNLCLLKANQCENPKLKQSPDSSCNIAGSE